MLPGLAERPLFLLVTQTICDKVLYYNNVHYATIKLICRVWCRALIKVSNCCGRGHASITTCAMPCHMEFRRGAKDPMDTGSRPTTKLYLQTCPKLPESHTPIVATCSTSIWVVEAPPVTVLRAWLETCISELTSLVIVSKARRCL